MVAAGPSAQIRIARPTRLSGASRESAEQGKLRILMIMRDFHGWTAGALWEDMKFEFKHWRDIEKLAMVGEAKWEKGMATFCKPFTNAKIRYFDHTQLEEARKWIASEE